MILSVRLACAIDVQGRAQSDTTREDVTITTIELIGAALFAADDAKVATRYIDSPTSTEPMLRYP